MAEIQRLPSSRGFLFYSPGASDRLASYGSFPLARPARRPRLSRIVISPVLALDPQTPNTESRKRCFYAYREKLAASRETALRFFRSVISTHTTPPKAEPITTRGRTESQSTASRRASEVDMPSTDFLRSTPRQGNSPAPAPAAGAGPAPSSPRSRPSMPRLTPRASRGSLEGSRPQSPTIPEERPLASGNGVSVSVNLAEPLLYLQGFDQNDTVTRNTVMLRGNLHLKVTKTAKLKAVTLKFKGTAQTKWPEGIPPKKVDFEETDTLMSHTWPFFNAQFPTAHKTSGADVVRLADGKLSSQDGGSAEGMLNIPSQQSISIMNVNGRDPKRLSLQNTYSKSFDKTEVQKVGPTVQQKGYRTFVPGDYIYNFELPLDSRMPETIDVDLGSVKYELEASIERAGAFRANLLGSKEITLIRAPTEGSLEQVEPIAISRNWEDQLHYDIVISGKSFPLGSKVPIAFKLTPLAKVQCHRIKVFVTENMEYFCSNKRVHRMEPTRKVLLFERRADGTATSTFPGSTMKITAGGGIPFDQREAAARGETVTPQDTSNLLGRLEGNSNVGPTEMEFSVQLPGCQVGVNEKEKVKDALHFDTTYQNIQVHHWIKIVMRLSRPDENDSAKRRHFEISIDSPFHILSCRANQTNISLPAYSSPHARSQEDPSGHAECGCPGAPRRRMSPNYVPTVHTFNADANGGAGLPTTNTGSSEGSIPEVPLSAGLSRPPAAHLHGALPTSPPGHLQRPMHLLREPSFNPPDFEADQPPPPLVTPPPQYNDIASPTAGHGLADYFSRLAEAYEENTEGEEGDDEEGSSDDGRASIRGRVNIPLTPGSRLNRSMDLQRSWVPVGQ